jgi:hypothetical protein
MCSCGKCIVFTPSRDYADVVFLFGVVTRHLLASVFKI